MTEPVDIDYVCAQVLENCAALKRLKAFIRERVLTAVEAEARNLATQGDPPEWDPERCKFSNGRPSETLLPFLLKIGPYDGDIGLATGDVAICNLCHRVAREGEEAHCNDCPGRWMPSTAHRYRDGKYIGSVRCPL